MLKWFKFPPGLLSFLVKELLYNEKTLHNVDKKIMKIIDYILNNFCSFEFTENASMYFNIIINLLGLNDSIL
jgi:hypothetical protein